MIDTATKQLLPWRTRLWDDNLQFVGGIQRIISGSIAPDDSVVRRLAAAPAATARRSTTPWSPTR